MKALANLSSCRRRVNRRRATRGSSVARDRARLRRREDDSESRLPKFRSRRSAGSAGLPLAPPACQRAGWPACRPAGLPDCRSAGLPPCGRARVVLIASLQRLRKIIASNCRDTNCKFHCHGDERARRHRSAREIPESASADLPVCRFERFAALPLCHYGFRFDRVISVTHCTYSPCHRCQQ